MQTKSVDAPWWRRVIHNQPYRANKAPESRCESVFGPTRHKRRSLWVLRQGSPDDGEAEVGTKGLQVRELPLTGRRQDPKGADQHTENASRTAVAQVYMDDGGGEGTGRMCAQERERARPWHTCGIQKGQTRPPSRAQHTCAVSATMFPAPIVIVTGAHHEGIDENSTGSGSERYAVTVREALC